MFCSGGWCDILTTIFSTRIFDVRFFGFLIIKANMFISFNQYQLILIKFALSYELIV